MNAVIIHHQADCAPVALCIINDDNLYNLNVRVGKIIDAFKNKHKEFTDNKFYVTMNVDVFESYD